MTWDWCSLSSGDWGSLPRGAALESLGWRKGGNSQDQEEDCSPQKEERRQRKGFDMLEEQKEDQWRTSWRTVIEQEDGGRGSQRYREGQSGGGGHHGRKKVEWYIMGYHAWGSDHLFFPPQTVPLSLKSWLSLLSGSLGAFWPLSAASVPHQKTCSGKRFSVEERSWLWIQKVLDLNSVWSWGINFSEPHFS